MADPNKYKYAGGVWTASSGCGCGGAKKTQTIATGVNPATLLLYTQAIAMVITAQVGSYQVQPHTILLDVDPIDFETLKADHRFKVPTEGDLKQFFGMKVKG